ncbi:hypothetical protein T484DRAFT_1914969, partial [Baffinella frigidus]
MLVRQLLAKDVSAASMGAEGWALLGSLATGSLTRLQAAHQSFGKRADEAERRSLHLEALLSLHAPTPTSAPGVRPGAAHTNAASEGRGGSREGLGGEPHASANKPSANKQSAHKTDGVTHHAPSSHHDASSSSHRSPEAQGTTDARRSERVRSSLNATHSGGSSKPSGSASLLDSREERSPA